MYDNIKFEVRSVKPFQAKSQQYTLQTAYPDIDDRGNRTGKVSVLTDNLDVRTFSTSKEEERKAYNNTPLAAITLSPTRHSFIVPKDHFATADRETAVRRFFRNHPNVVDYNDPSQYDKVANMPIGAKANAQFIFEDKASTVDSQIEESEKSSLIQACLIGNKSKAKVLRDMLFYLGENPSESMTDKEMYVSLINLTVNVGTRHREKFYNTYVEHAIRAEDVHITTLANKAISKGNITSSNGIFRYGTEAIGTKFEQVLLWLKNNDSARGALEQDLKYFEDGSPAAKRLEVPKAPKLDLEEPYTDEEFAVVKVLAKELDVTRIELVGNIPNKPRTCSLSKLVEYVNEKGAGKENYVKFTPSDVRGFIVRQDVDVTLDNLHAVRGE